MPRPLTAVALVLLAAIAQPAEPFVKTFAVETGELTSTGRNDYFVLEPRHQATFVHGDEKLVITVTAATKIIDGVETRVVEERETRGGVLVEVSRNYFAISKKNGNVYYFGEDVDIFEKGKLASHDGAWRSGINGATFGLMMPGKATPHARYYQEVAPGVAMDRAEIVSVTAQHKLPDITYTDVVKVEETTPLEPGHKEYKWYARGIGLIADGELELMRVGRKR